MNILVIAAHPDDEILGVGGTVAKHAANGDHVFAMILGEGQTSRFDKREDAGTTIIEKLHGNTIKAAEVIGFREVFFENFADNRFDSVDLLDVVKVIEKRVNQLQPEIIYTHHKGDLNVDHLVTYRAVLTATRPMQDCPVKEIYTFETLSSTEWNFTYGDDSFAPNVFIDVEPYFNQKLESMRQYETELCEFPHPRSLKALTVTAQKWGSVVGRNYVEAFEVVRVIR